MARAPSARVVQRPALVRAWRMLPNDLSPWTVVEQPARGCREVIAHDIKLEVVKLAAAQHGFVLLPCRWVVKRSFVWLAGFRRLSRDYERLATTLVGRP